MGVPGAGPPRGIYARCGKAAFDRIVALVGLVLFGPLLMLVAAVVLVALGRPVLFRQRRPGLDGELFTLVKFRTMRESSPGTDPLSTDEVRLTRVGRILRASSLDELPELWNVLMGHMSLVGPRPLLPEYLSRYSTEQKRRHDVRPGITGLAQVSGRNAQTWRERFALDLWYVDHLSFSLDLKILAMTGLQVVRREGVSAPGHATMPPFTGDPVE